jgi:hypothetical protein
MWLCSQIACNNIRHPVQTQWWSAAWCRTSKSHALSPHLHLRPLPLPRLQ